jgi:hypothetical protein
VSHLLGNLLVFGRVLRRAGLQVHPGRLVDLVEALSHVDLRDRREVYHACRALLVHRQDELAVFDAAFAAFWRERRDGPARDRRRAAGSRPQVSTVMEIADLVEPPGMDEPLPNADGPPADIVKTWSDRGGVANRDFAAFTPDELEEARAALSRLEWHPGERRTRRWIRGRGARVDLRRAIADSLRTGGDIARLPRRTRRVRPRRLVLLCDVSGSMERYTRMLLHFAHAVTKRNHRVETFLFATRLTRITRELRASGPDQALTAASAAVTDWSGGTRIGAAIREFHQRWGRRVLQGGSVVVIVSDGWDRGDPIELAMEIARLQRSCHRLVWLNPLIGTADYAPLTRGLQAALPFVDDFLPARTLTNLADLAIHLNALG